MVSELKPCPFCENLTPRRQARQPFEEVIHYIDCTECGCVGPASAHANGAAEAWNCRATLASRAAVREPAKCVHCYHDAHTMWGCKADECQCGFGEHEGKRSVEPKTETCKCGHARADHHECVNCNCDSFSTPVAPRPADAELIEMRDRFRASGRPDKRQYAELFDELLQARATLANRAAVREPAKCELSEAEQHGLIDAIAMAHVAVNVATGEEHKEALRMSNTLKALYGRYAPAHRSAPADWCNNPNRAKRFTTRSVEPKTETCAYCGKPEHSPRACPPVAPRPAEDEGQVVACSRGDLSAGDLDKLVNQLCSPRSMFPFPDPIYLSQVALLELAKRLRSPATPPASASRADDEVREALVYAADYLGP